MDVKLLNNLKERLSVLDEKSLGLGFAGGVLATLGLSLLVPDTASHFVDEARGRLTRNKHRKRDEQDTFFAETLKEDRQAAQSRNTEMLR